MTTLRQAPARMAAATALAIASWCSFALDYQLHGFAAQGAVFSGGNQLYGDSIHGSFQYHEAGINGTLAARPNLLFSAQAVARDAGETDNDGMRLDYAQMDWRFLQTSDGGAGMRLGRVKNPYGLYNDTRDLVFSRPGILLPQSIYFDNLGFRGLLFSSDGGQLYGDWTAGEHTLSAVLTGALDRNAGDEEKRQFSGGGLAPSGLRFEDLEFVRILDEVGSLQYGLSAVHAKIEFAASSPVPMSGLLRDTIYVASVRYNQERWNLTAEYSLTDSSFDSSTFGSQHTKGDGFYLQGGYLFSHHWSGFLRYDALFGNRNDRDGSESVSPFQPSRYQAFAHDGVIGFGWKHGEHWGAWAEQHWVYGTASVSSADNAGRSPAPHWNAFLLMAAYRF